MIIRRLARGSSVSGKAGELRYVRTLTRYTSRADTADLQALVGLTSDPYLNDLASYVTRSGVMTGVAATGAMGLHGETLEEWQAELEALIHRCPQAEGAVGHWVKSWKNERPSIAQVQDCLSEFAKAQAQARKIVILWALHDDTDHTHLHMVVVQIDRETGERVSLGGGWDLETAQRVKAVLEARHGWAAEERSRYRVQHGQLVHLSSGDVIGDAADPSTWRPPNRQAARLVADSAGDVVLDPGSTEYEEETGLMSARRVALEIAVPLLLKSGSFAEAHRKLGAEGIELRGKGTGAVLMIDGIKVKASVDRRTSRSALQKLYGSEFQPRPPEVEVRSFAPRTMWPNDAARQLYFEAKRTHDARLKLVLADVRAALASRTVPAHLASGIIAAVSGGAKFPSFEAFQHGARAPTIDDIAWTALASTDVGLIVSPKHVNKASLPPPMAVGEFKPLRSARGFVSYRRPGEGGRPAFVDVGQAVLVNAIYDRNAVRAAAKLQAMRHPHDIVLITGGDETFRRLAVEAAKELGLRYAVPGGSEAAGVGINLSSNPVREATSYTREEAPPRELLRNQPRRDGEMSKPHDKVRQAQAIPPASTFDPTQPVRSISSDVDVRAGSAAVPVSVGRREPEKAGGHARGIGGAHPLIDAWITAKKRNAPLPESQRCAFAIVSDAAANELLRDIDRNTARRIREDADLEKARRAHQFQMALQLGMQR